MSGRYESKSDLPDTVADVLPDEAQEVYLKGYQRGWDKFTEATSAGLSRESVAHRQGWEAVKREFVLEEGLGAWYRRGEAPDEEARPLSFLDRLRGLFGGGGG